VTEDIGGIGIARVLLIENIGIAWRKKWGNGCRYSEVNWFIILPAPYQHPRREAVAFRTKFSIAFKNQQNLT
jgi:hypothetical protein